MSSRIRRALTELEQDVAGLQLAPPEAIRARGRARRRRRTVGVTAAVAVGVSLAGAAVLPPLFAAEGGPGGRLPQVTAGSGPGDRAGLPTGTAVPSGCVSPGPSGTSPASSPGRLGPSATPSSGTAGRSRAVRIFLAHAVSPAEKSAVEATLRGLPEVTAIGFLSHDEQWRRFAAQFCFAPDLVAATRPESLPEAFDVTLFSPEDYPRVEAAVRRLPGVSEVVPSS
ncbi:permease-like cell division protein FtsX [Planosporangium sp. 12N6]|uniref:permease-like cell division protein FtsX n=1 Tax=Planosporangium spinosum TaxID=3402278 RepID=UPI003CEF95B7